MERKVDSSEKQYTILLADDHTLIRLGIRNLISNNPALKGVFPANLHSQLQSYVV